VLTCCQPPEAPLPGAGAEAPPAVAAATATGSMAVLWHMCREADAARGRLEAELRAERESWATEREILLARLRSAEAAAPSRRAGEARADSPVATKSMALSPIKCQSPAPPGPLPLLLPVLDAARLAAAQGAEVRRHCAAQRLRAERADEAARRLEERLRELTALCSSAEAAGGSAAIEVDVAPGTSATTGAGCVDSVGTPLAHPQPSSTAAPPARSGGSVSPIPVCLGSEAGVSPAWSHWSRSEGACSPAPRPTQRSRLSFSSDTLVTPKTCGRISSPSFSPTSPFLTQPSKGMPASPLEAMPGNGGDHLVVASCEPEGRSSLADVDTSWKVSLGKDSPSPESAAAPLESMLEKSKRNSVTVVPPLESTRGTATTQPMSEVPARGEEVSGPWMDDPMQSCHLQRRAESLGRRPPRGGRQPRRLRLDVDSVNRLPEFVGRRLCKARLQGRFMY